MTKILQEDLLAAAEWLDTYEGPNDDPVKIGCVKVANMLRKMYDQRQMNNAISNVQRRVPNMTRERARAALERAMAGLPATG